jgi:crotonobetainyl-CoA:carnitine CoA-transferase CaiB-like acyl-CoA transferase
MSNGALDGIRVLDLTRILAGPSATQMLGDMGADVIKIERPPGGDDTRSWGPPYVKNEQGQDTSESGYYLCANRNKRSVAIDFTTEEGAETVRKLVAKADILIENFKVGGLAKYGLDYESLREINPSLIYCSITGFGQTGPNAKRAGYDAMIQGYSGIMSLTGPPNGEPYKVGVAIVDVMCGMHATTGILAALHHRHRTGVGQHIDIALADSQVSWLVNQGANYLLNGKVPPRYGNAHPNIVPYQVFSTSDGHMIVSVGNDEQFRRFVTILGCPELAADERFSTNPGRVKHRETLIPLLEDAVAGFQKSKLMAEMESQGVPGGPVHTLDEVFASDQVAARDMIVRMPYDLAQDGEVRLIGNPIKFSETPVTYRQAPPRCGEHTEAVMRDWLDEDG